LHANLAYTKSEEIMSAQTAKTISSKLVDEFKFSNHENNSSTITSTSISEQFNKLKQLVVVNDTARTFKKSLRLLFVLIRESMILIWLAVCWGIVAVHWVGTYSTQMGQGVKNWWKAFHEIDSHQSKMDIAAEVAQNAMQNLVSKAKKQIGIQDNQ
jgi:hypothetical protein